MRRPSVTALWEVMPRLAKAEVGATTAVVAAAARSVAAVYAALAWGRRRRRPGME